MTHATDRITEERTRQIEEEGYDEQHDRGHTKELLDAAECYVTAARRSPVRVLDPDIRWPWSAQYWNPSDDPRRNLVKAGALIAAALDSLYDHSEHILVDAYAADCVHGACEHSAEDDETGDACPTSPYEVCVDCMDEEGHGRTEEDWDDAPLSPWPHPGAVGWTETPALAADSTEGA